MKKGALNITLVDKEAQIPRDLLALADPSKAQVDAYLKTGDCYIATLDTEVVGVMVLQKIDSTSIEVKNIAVKESAQGKGLGKELLKYADQRSRKQGYKKLVIGTGNSSIGQLALYQKQGFEIIRIEKNFFLDHYHEPIIENGIQCKHMIILEKLL